MPVLSYSELQGVTGGRWLVPPAVDAAPIEVISDDSRALPAGALFIAIVGELTDGHRYLPQAVRAGAVAVLVQHAPEEMLLAELRGAKCACIQVADSLRAYQQLALWHRRQFPDARILAITGSCGKTSTKEMCAAILEEHFPGGVLKTIGSTNNHFGVPRNLYRMDAKTRVAVIEMGTNHPGEIANLVSLAPPEVGAVCCIGRAHLEFFHDLEGVAQEKSALLSGVLPSGVAVYPLDAVGAETLRKAAGGRRIRTFGTSPDADLQYAYLGADGAGSFRMRLRWKDSGEERIFVWGLGGAHMAANAACAAAAVGEFGCSPDEIVVGLQKCRLPGARLEVREIDGVHWVNDAFNSNPTSLRASLEWFSEVVPKGSRAYLVLGDMLELGAESAEEHLKALRYAVETFPGAEILAVGEAMPAAVAKIQSPRSEKEIGMFASAQEAKAFLQTHAKTGDWILLKSSHGIGLAGIVEK